MREKNGCKNANHVLTFEFVAFWVRFAASAWELTKLFFFFSFKLDFLMVFCHWNFSRRVSAVLSFWVKEAFNNCRNDLECFVFLFWGWKFLRIFSVKVEREKNSLLLSLERAKNYNFFKIKILNFPHIFHTKCQTYSIIIKRICKNKKK